MDTTEMNRAEMAAKLRELDDSLAVAAAREERLRRLLRPFAAYARWLDKGTQWAAGTQLDVVRGDEWCGPRNPTVGDCRDAAAELGDDEAGAVPAAVA